MSNIVYKASDDWIPQGDRTLKTFASGLAMVQQTYIAPKSSADYSAFKEGDFYSNASPFVFPGAYIFPEPELREMGNGLVSCTVTAYGRTKSAINRRVSRRVAIIDFYTVGALFNDDGNFLAAFAEKDPQKSIIEFEISSCVVASSESVSPSASKTLNVCNANGNLIVFPKNSPPKTFRQKGGTSGLGDILETYIATTSSYNELESYEEIYYGGVKEVIWSFVPKTSGSVSLQNSQPAS
jgi:hypothetical protein